MLSRVGCRRCLILCVVQERYFWECYLTTIANMRDRPFPFQLSYIICITYQHGKRKWPDNPRNSFSSHTKHDSTAPGKDKDETEDILAHSPPSDRKIEKLHSSAIGNTRTQTRNQRLNLDQWALMSFHILFSVPSASVNSESATLLYGFLCFSRGDCTWYWLLSDPGDSGSGVIRLSLFQCTWSEKDNISPIEQKFRLLEAQVTFNNRYITTKTNLTRPAQRLRISTQPETIETIETNPHGLCILWRNKTRNTLLLPLFLSDGIYIFHGNMPSAPVLLAVTQPNCQHFLRRTISTQRTILVDQADSHPDLSFLNLHLRLSQEILAPWIVDTIPSWISVVMQTAFA